MNTIAVDIVITMNEILIREKQDEFNKILTSLRSNPTELLFHENKYVRDLAARFIKKDDK